MDREVVRRADDPEASPEPVVAWRGVRRQRPVTPDDPWEGWQRLAVSTGQFGFVVERL